MTDNPYDVADKWLLKENLPLSFREQIVEFILQNTGQRQFTPDPSFRDPYTGSKKFLFGYGIIFTFDFSDASTLFLCFHGAKTCLIVVPIFLLADSAYTPGQPSKPVGKFEVFLKCLVSLAIFAVIIQSTYILSLLLV